MVGAFTVWSGLFLFYFFGRERHLEYLPYIVLGAGLTRAGVAFFYGCIFSDFFFRFLLFAVLYYYLLVQMAKKSFSLRIQCAQEDTLFVPAILSIF